MDTLAAKVSGLCPLPQARDCVPYPPCYASDGSPDPLAEGDIVLDSVNLGTILPVAWEFGVWMFWTLPVAAIAHGTGLAPLPAAMLWVAIAVVLLALPPVAYRRRGSRQG